MSDATVNMEGEGAVTRLGPAVSVATAGDFFSLLKPRVMSLVVFTSLAGLLQGDARAGLTHTGPVAGPMMLWIAMAIFTILTLTLVSMAGVYGWRRWGGGAMLGMASAVEAHRLLGAERLWHVRHIIRPDLYPPRRRGAL